MVCEYCICSTLCVPQEPSLRAHGESSCQSQGVEGVTYIEWLCAVKVAVLCQVLASYYISILYWTTVFMG